MLTKKKEKLPELPIRPGRDTYSDTVKGKKKDTDKNNDAGTLSSKTAQKGNAIVFSTSITKGIYPPRLNSKYENGSIRLQRFHGGQSRFAGNYMSQHLFEERPETVIVQFGGNDLATSRINPTPISKVANQVIEAGLLCKQFDVQNIIISGVTTRKNEFQQKRCEELNIILKGLCDRHNFVFIDNSMITVNHLYDGVHLNDDGTKILADNYLTTLWQVHNT